MDHQNPHHTPPAEPDGTPHGRWRNRLVWGARGFFLLVLLCLAVLAFRLTGPWHSEVSRRMACLRIVAVQDLDQWTPRMVLNLPFLRFVVFRTEGEDRRYLVVQRWWGPERFVAGFLEKFVEGATIPHYRRMGGYTDLTVTATGTLVVNGEDRPWAEITYLRNDRHETGLLACFGTTSQRFLMASNGTPESYTRAQALALLETLAVP